MLRAAIKYGISKALSTRAGFEVWDFEIREEQPSPDRVTLDIRYRYHPSLCFNAAITTKSEEGKVPSYEITAQAVPGEVGEKEELLLAGRQELCTAIERWTTRIEEELSARPSNRVLAAQQKAISYLEKHLLDIPDQQLTRERIHEYQRRLERLEAAVIELRTPRSESANGAHAEAVRQEFACLRSRLEVLGERSFLHSVLVRLVKHFWDDENLRIIEAGSRAAQAFLADPEHSLAVARSEPPARSTPPAPAPLSRAANTAAPAAPRPPLPPQGRAPARPEPTPVPAATRTPAKAPAAPAKSQPAKPAASPAPAPDRQRAAYKPLRPNRG